MVLKQIILLCTACMTEEATSPLIFSSRAYFRAIYNLVDDAVFLYRPSESMVVEGNRSFRTLMNAPHSAALSLPLSHIFSPLFIHQLALGRKVLNAELRCADNALLPVRLHLQEVLLADEPLLLGVAHRHIMQPADADQALIAAELEKKALLNEVYHRVKNNLNIIISLISLQLNRVQDAELRHLLKESKSRIYTLALLQERLYHSPKLSEVKAGEYLTSLAQSVIATFKESKQQIKLMSKTQECWLNVDVLVPLGLIVHELVANAVLHAYAEQKTGEVMLTLSFNGAHEYELAISDVGKGLPEGANFISFKSLGAQLVVSLSKQLKARLLVESSSGKGTKIVVKFSSKS